MKVFVTGGSGFVGSAIAKRLLAEGADVRVLVRRGGDELKARGADVVFGDLRDVGVLRCACSGRDVVFHVAARVGIWGPWKEFYETNVLGTKNVTEACTEGNVGALIYTSSPSVVYDGDDLAGVSESVPYARRFVAHYPASKALAEQQLIQSHREQALRTLALRPHLIWGPGDTHVVPAILERGRRGSFALVGDGSNLVDCTYIENVVVAHLQAASALLNDARVGGQAYFISQGEPLSLRSFVTRVLACAGLEPRFRSLPTALAYLLGAGFETVYSLLRLSGEPRLTRFLVGQLSTSHYFDIRKAKTLLGYRPEVTMDEGFDALRKSFTL